VVAELAAAVGVWVVLGSANPLTPPYRPHNSLYVISDRDEIVEHVGEAISLA
jgi:predicted amidohydrolase